jgi:hypothetical protein
VVSQARTLLALVVAATLLVAACAGTTEADVVSGSGPTDVESETSSTENDPTTDAAQTTNSVSTPTPAAPLPGHIGSGQPVTFAFGGDVHYEGPLATTLETSPDTMLAGVAGAFGPADLSVVNLETAVADEGDPAAKSFNFKVSPAAFDSLRAGGVDVISMANNHGMDYGATGLEQTFAAIADKSAPVIGIGRDETEAYAPFTTEINGQRIAVISATQVMDSNLIPEWTALADQPGLASAKRVERLIEEVARTRLTSDTLIVYLHWGTEKLYCPNDDQVDLSQRLIDAGADIVVGGHAHRVQAGGYLGDAYVHYGLGNLQVKAGSTEARETGILMVTATGRRIDDANWIPAQIGGDYLPRLTDGAPAEAAIGRWNARRDCSGLAEQPLTTTTATTTPSGG